MSLHLTAAAARVRPALALLLGTLTVTLGLSVSTEATASLAVVAATAILVLAVSVVATIASPRTLTVGARSQAHRESLTATPEPTHPDTTGRVRARAPGEAPQAA